MSEKLFDLQLELYEIIKRSQINFKKSPKVRLTHTAISSRVEQLEKDWANFQRNHFQLSQSNNKEIKENNYFKSNVYDEVFDLYLEFKSEMKDMLRPITSSTPQKSSSDDNNSKQDIKLPKINIPQFNGNYQEWSSFYDLFTSLIHQNKKLNEVEKMHYLKSSLTGEAEQLLKHFTVTEKNYLIAWQLLQNRYNNKKLIVNSIISRLINQRKVTNSSAKYLRELIDTTSECLNKLKCQDVDTSTWDVIIVYLTVIKLDLESRKEWEQEISSLETNELPTLQKLIDFLEKRFRILEIMQNDSKIQKLTPIVNRSFHISSPSTDNNCAYCQNSHYLYNCKEFAKLDEDKKTEIVQNQHLCFNCLAPGHSVKFCKSKSTCRRCGKKHHSLLHRISHIPNQKQNTNEEHIEKEIVSHFTSRQTMALMSTAIINVKNQHNQVFPLRALLDPCSQESFISTSAVQLIKLTTNKINGHVIGVGQMQTTIKASCDFEISSRINSNWKMNITAYVIQKITKIMPYKKFYNKWEHLNSGFTLADPTYNQPGHIDLLLGVEVCNEIMLPGLIKGIPGSPLAQQTHLGWILSGKINTENQNIEQPTIVSMHLDVDLNNMLQKFWQIEDIEETNKSLSADEMETERIYEETTTRDKDGRFIVNLPFRRNPPLLPTNSKAKAIQRYKSMENKLSKNKQLKKEYNNVLQEYLDLNHMEKITSNPNYQVTQSCVYLPHHAVIKNERETSKVRLVFDASCRGSNGKSLNEELLKGPVIQSDLREILFRWRTHKVAIVADIEKMYRQIKVCQPHTDLQRIIWRPDPLGELEEYRLLTVTFGMACAPYLAVKTLRETAIRESDDASDARKAILNDFYMDDLLSGSDNELMTIQLHHDIDNILKAGGFKTQKWCSNSEYVIKAINTANKNQNNLLKIQTKNKIKTLGIVWNVQDDTISVITNINENSRDLTKRAILSQIASLFDPMGLIAPTVLIAKLFMQRLWKCNLPWDSKISENMKREWLQFRSELQYLKDISINRWIYTNQTNHIQLHGYADASSVAFGAVVYARVIDKTKEIKVSLLAAKTKVAPIRKQLTLPRLELCAATLLSKLLTQISTYLNVRSENLFAWSDSQVALAWIKGDPSRWSTYVKNRVIEITKNVNPDKWYYINTKYNPADVASRGLMPLKLLNSQLWWSGPEMLRENIIKPEKIENLETYEEEKQIECNLTNNKIDKENGDIHTLLKKFSSLSKLIRVLAYCRRFIMNLKSKKSNKTYQYNSYLKTEELDDALVLCLKWSQEIDFPEELKSLKSQKIINKRSKIISLSPFLDEKGLIRVGGRLKHSEMSYIKKHPIILSKNNILLPLLISDAHHKTLHGGPQLMISYLRNKYWLIDAMNTVKKYARNCVTCARQAASNSYQMMGELPKERVTPAKVFLRSGVDYAGPFNLLTTRKRGAKTFKAYIAIFVCMSTKAVHIELASQLSTESFINAFKRFVSRRGRCTDIWSDQGTNFKGASKELRKLWKESITSDQVREQLANDGTNWHFIPPYSPNFGGLWEAAVKSVKYHLRRIITNHLTFEEMYTILVQVEACLNSRPLEPLKTADPDNIECLTPGHFIVGEPLITVPEPALSPQSTINRISCWKNTQRLLQSFWKAWSNDYLNSLQRRTKWQVKKPEFQVGDVVILKDENLPPSKWALARILEKHVGTDGLTRVYTLKYQTKTIKRPISKICSLPI